MTPLTLLYVPADRPERVARALASDADAVIVDLEDAVAPSAKQAAREGLAALDLPTGRGVQVRVNAAGTPWYHDDLAALAVLPADVGVRVPKCEQVGGVADVAARTGGRPLHLLLESALGVERAFELACVPGVASIGLGEADLLADLQASDPAALDHPRGRVVCAAAAAGLPPPAMSVHTAHRDLDGLRRTSQRGRALGFRGRAAIHPAQLPVIREVFAPTPLERERAEQVLAAAREGEQVGRGAFALPDGRFVDAAVVRQARAVLDLVRDDRG